MHPHDDDDESLPTPRRLRLIPLTVIMLGLLLVIKVNELYIGSRQLREFYTTREAYASGAKEAEKPTEHAAAEEKKDDKKEEKKEEKKDSGHGADAKEGDKPAEHAASDEKKDAGHGDAKEGDKKEEKKEGGHGEAKEGGEHGSAKPPEEPKTYGTGKSTIKEIEELKEKNATTRFSKSEIDLLENLSKRRDALEQREKDLEMKTKVLEATQKRIDDKIGEMKTLEAQLSKTVAQYNEKQDMQIASLVKIYEAMKPAQAAAIFNELDLPILLEVIDKMSERRVAPVLALMDPKKAKDVTQELAAMRKSAPKASAPAPKP